MSKVAASKLSSKNSRKPSVVEQDGPPSVDRDARIVCPFPEWNDEHVNILLKKLGTGSEQAEQVPPTSAKGAKPPTSARGAKPAQPREDDGIDSSILDFQFEPLALKDEQVEWKQISKRSKIRILRSRAPRHPFLTAPPTPDLPPTVEERVHELDAKAQEDAAAAADPKGKKKPTTPSTTSKAPPAKQQAAQSVEDQKKMTLELQKIKHQEDLHAEVNVLEEHQAIEMYSEYADFPKLLRKGVKCRAFNSALYIVKHLYKHVPIGNYLWELIHPKTEGSDYMPSNQPFTKYIVKLWYMGCYRIVVVDDYVPHTQNDNTLSFPETSKNEIWPTILFKALLKLAKGREQQVFDDPLFTLQALIPGFSRQQLDPIEQQLRCIRILHSVVEHQKQNTEITPFDEFVAKRKEEQLRLKKEKEKEAQQLQAPISQQASGLSSRAQTTQASRAPSAAPTARSTTAAGPQTLGAGMLSAAPSAAPTARAAAPLSTTFSIPIVEIVQPEEPKKVARRLLFATCRSDPNLATEIKNLGLCPSKLYLIDDIKIHEEENLLRIMAMKTNWKGSCSYDDSSFWTAQFEESIGFARQDRLCSQATVNDFWITFTDFCKYFQAVHEFFETAVLEEKVVLFGQNLPQTFYCFVQNDAQLFLRLSRVSYRNTQQDRPPSAAAPVPAKPGPKAAAQAAAQQQQAPQPSMEIVPLGTPIQCSLQVESYDWLLAQPFEKLSAVSLQLYNDVPHFVPVPAVPRPRTMLPNPEAAQPEPTATARSAAPTSRVTTPQSQQHTGAVASSPAVSMQQQFQNYSILKFQLLEGSGQDLVLELLSDKRVANIGNEKEIFKQNLLCNITEIEETYTNHQASGEWKLWFLKKLRIDEPLMFSAQLQLLDMSEQASQLASAIEFGIINNATNAYTPSYLGRILPIQLKPNGESGYNLVASARMRPNPEGSSQATIPGGKFKLHMISSGLAPLYDNIADLSPFHPVQLKGTYMPNSSRELFQYEVWAGEMSYAAMHLSLSNHIPTVLEVLCNGRLIYHGDIGKWNYMVVPCIEHTPSSAKGEAKCFLYRAIISEDYADYLLSKRLIAAERRFKRLVNERAQNAEDLPDEDAAAQRKSELANGKNSSRKLPHTPKQQQKPKAGAAAGGKAAPTVRIPAKQDKPQVVEPTEEDNLRELDGINSSDSLSYELTIMYSSPNIYIEKLDPKRQKLEEYQSNWESKEPNRSTLAKESRESFYTRVVRQEYQRLKELDALNNGTKPSKIQIVLPAPEEIRPPSKGTARSTKPNSTATTRPATVVPKSAKQAEEPKPEIPKPVLNLNLVEARPTDPAWLRRGTTSWLDKEMEEYKQVLHPSKPSEHLSIITKEDLDERKQRLETSITMANRHLDELKTKRAQEHEEHEKSIRETETQLADFFKQMKQLQIEQKKRILDAVQLKQQKLQEALAAQEAANAPPGKGKPATPSTAKRGK